MFTWNPHRKCKCTLIVSHVGMIPVMSVYLECHTPTPRVYLESVACGNDTRESVP